MPADSRVPALNGASVPQANYGMKIATRHGLNPARLGALLGAERSRRLRPREVAELDQLLGRLNESVLQAKRELPTASRDVRLGALTVALGQLSRSMQRDSRESRRAEAAAGNPDYINSADGVPFQTRERGLQSRAQQRAARAAAGDPNFLSSTPRNSERR